MATAPPRTFASLLRRLRRDAGMTQEELAERAGISVRSISDLERDVKHRPHKDTVQLLADALGVTGEDRTRFEFVARGSERVTVPLEANVPTDAERTNRLPEQPTPFLGREHDTDGAVTMLRRPEVRMLTLTGTGGSGKTRLALHVAERLAPEFADGACFVPLAPLDDPDLVLSAIATVLEVKESAEQTLDGALIAHLSSKSLLLLLDNFEHLLAAAAPVASLLATCPGLTLLITSRTPLRLAGEYLFPVSSLSLPDNGYLSPEEAELFDAVALFVTRARSIQPDFRLTPDSTPAVVEICRRLDGLPLAIELAVPWLRLFPPDALSNRLERRLPLLASGPRDAPARHQTLRSCLDWGYTLLSPEEQDLLARLAVFAVGCSLSAAEAVCASDGESDVLTGIASLLEKNFLRQQEGPGQEPRVVMLETIREYAAERLDATATQHLLRRNHARYYLEMALTAEIELRGSGQKEWFARLTSDHDNLRAALQWLIEHGEAEMSLRLAASLWRFWVVRGYLSEGRRWVERALAGAGSASLGVRANALQTAAILAYQQGEFRQAQVWFEESLSLWRQSGETDGISRALNNLGNVTYEMGELERAASLYEESLALYRGGERTWEAGSPLGNLGLVAEEQGDYDRAWNLHQETLAIWREAGDRQKEVESLHHLGRVAVAQRDYERAAALFSEGAALADELEDPQNRAASLNELAYVMFRQGRAEGAATPLQMGLEMARKRGFFHELARGLQVQALLLLATGDETQALSLVRESLRLHHRAGHMVGVAKCIEQLAGLAVARGLAERCAKLLAAADSIRLTRKCRRSPDDAEGFERDLARARTELPETDWKAAWSEGSALSVEDAVTYALSED